jgi:hypothetical protein
LFGFETELHVITRSQFGVYPKLKPDDGALAKWWEKNKRRGLRAIQIEAIDAMITFMTSIDGKTAPTIHPDVQRRPLKEFNRLRDDNLRILKLIRRNIVEKQEPHRAKSLDDSIGCLFGLPWTSRRHNL